MKVLSWNNLKESDFLKKTCLTIGVFDGIHAGHKKLLDKVLQVSEEKNLVPGLVTFTDSIFTMFKNSGKPLQTLEERLSCVKKMGFEFCILIDFTPEIARTEGTVFLYTLMEKCRLSYLVEGEDFRLGNGGRTGMAEIDDFCRKNNIGVSFIPPVLYEGKRISSTMIRNLIKNGDTETASRLLSLK
ncbi:MAG: FAD synthetase family protein [Treponema sp.]|nr:FAD synthetase family protein [Treponema sp.]